MAIAEASETTASDIEQAGQAAVEIAAAIMKEAQQLAAGLRANGRKMSEHLQEFAVLARKVSTAMRDTRPEGLSAREHRLPRQPCFRHKKEEVFTDLPQCPAGTTGQHTAPISSYRHKAMPRRVRSAPIV